MSRHFPIIVISAGNNFCRHGVILLSLPQFVSGLSAQMWNPESGLYCWAADALVCPMPKPVIARPDIL